jgi:hypothetical protein
MIFFHGVPVSIVIIEVLSGAADGDDAIIIPIKASEETSTCYQCPGYTPAISNTS